jgi:hypothetical protein
MCSSPRASIERRSRISSTTAAAPSFSVASRIWSRTRPSSSNSNAYCSLASPCAQLSLAVAFDFNQSRSLRKWLCQGGQTFSEVTLPAGSDATHAPSAQVASDLRASSASGATVAVAISSSCSCCCVSSIVYNSSTVWKLLALPTDAG